MEAAFYVELLEEALVKHGKSAVFNTDRGSQSKCPAFTGVLAKSDIMISKGAWRDNKVVERFCMHADDLLGGLDRANDPIIQSENRSEQAGPSLPNADSMAAMTTVSRSRHRRGSR